MILRFLSVRNTGLFEVEMLTLQESSASHLKRGGERRAAPTGATSPERQFGAVRPGNG